MVQARGATRWTTVQAIVLALAVGGCRKKAPEAAGAAQVDPVTQVIAAEVEDTPLDDRPTLALLGDAAARRAALAGSYVVSGDEGNRGSSDYTPPLALTIPATGDTVTIWNGRAEQTARLQLDSPCELALMRKHHDPDTGLDGEEGPTYYWRVHDGVAEVGRNEIGVRVGKGALVCADFGVLIVDANGRCMRHPSYGPTLEPARCGFRQDAGRDVFYYSKQLFPGETVTEEVVIAVDDWRIGTTAVLDDDKPRAWFRRYADQAEARAVVDADARANDPLFIAQAAGGVVGDRATVPGLVATFASDEKSLTGTVRVSGVVVRRRLDESDVLPPEAPPPPPTDDEPEREPERVEWLELADAAHRDRPSISCKLTAAIVRIPDGTAITVEGTVTSESEWWTRRAFAAPALQDCRVVASP